MMISTVECLMPCGCLGFVLDDKVCARERKFEGSSVFYLMILTQSMLGRIIIMVTCKEYSSVSSSQTFRQLNVTEDVPRAHRSFIHVLARLVGDKRNSRVPHNP